MTVSTNISTVDTDSSIIVAKVEKCTEVWDLLF